MIILVKLYPLYSIDPLLLSKLFLAFIYYFVLIFQGVVPLIIGCLATPKPPKLGMRSESTPRQSGTTVSHSQAWGEGARAVLAYRIGLATASCLEV